MGTDATYGFRKGGMDRLTNMNNSGYPSHLGVAILEYCRTHSVEEMSRAFDRIVMVPEGGFPTPKQVEDHLALARVEEDGIALGDGAIGSAYCLTREAQGELSVYDSGDYYVMDDDSAGMLGGRDWAYIINLDEGVLETYTGQNEHRDAPGRYAAIGGPEVHEAWGLGRLDGGREQGQAHTYYGLALLESVSLSSLPSPSAWAANLESAAATLAALRWAESYVEMPDGTRTYGEH